MIEEIKERKTHPNISYGEHTYFHKTVDVDFVSGPHKLQIGKFCSVAREVLFMLHGEHVTDEFSTYPFQSMFDDLIDLPKSNTAKGDIIIGNDVWIGARAVILSGVTIGDGAVIGAGSIVTRNVGAYEIHVGNPARFKRFRKNYAELKEASGWWDLPIDEIKAMARRNLVKGNAS